MAEEEGQEKVTSVVNLEDEDNHHSPLDNPSLDPDWTPGRGGNAGAGKAFSEPGKSPYNLRETIPKRSWSGDKYNTESVKKR